jgi:hypothetical protein
MPDENDPKSLDRVFDLLKHFTTVGIATFGVTLTMWPELAKAGMDHTATKIGLTFIAASVLNAVRGMLNIACHEAAALKGARTSAVLSWCVYLAAVGWLLAWAPRTNTWW